MKTWISTIVKYGVAVVGSFLAAKGIVDSEVITQFVDSTTAIITGIILVLISQFTSKE